MSEIKKDLGFAVISLPWDKKIPAEESMRQALGLKYQAMFFGLGKYSEYGLEPVVAVFGNLHVAIILGLLWQQDSILWVEDSELPIEEIQHEDNICLRGHVIDLTVDNLRPDNLPILMSMDMNFTRGSSEVILPRVESLDEYTLIRRDNGDYVLLEEV